MVGIQVLIAALVPLLPEEAYHWNFARHPDFSYFDHPPMIAWSIALGRLLLGDTVLGVRLIPLLFAAGTAMLLARLADRLYGQVAACAAVVLYASQPAALLVGGWGFPDAPLLFFWVLTLTWVWRAIDTGRPGWWLAAGGALGAAMLSKYTAAFLVPSVFLYLLCSRRDRGWLATPWPYLAGLCSLVVFAPVLYWNWAHHWASFEFQSTARFEAADEFSLGAGLRALVEQSLLILPLTVPLALVGICRAGQSSRPQEHFLFWSFVPTAAFFVVMGCTPSFHLLWGLPAFLGLTVAMAGTFASAQDWVARFYRRRWRSLVGIAAAAGMLFLLHTICVWPFAPPLREVYGWDRVADQARALHSTMPSGSFYMAVGGRPYPAASQLAFHLGVPENVYGANLIGNEALQYRFWVDPIQLAGKDAVVVVENGDPHGWIRGALTPYFRSIEPVGEELIPSGRVHLWPTPSVQMAFYRAYGYRPAAPVFAAK
jgi:hypothetical protein